MSRSFIPGMRAHVILPDDTLFYSPNTEGYDTELEWRLRHARDTITPQDMMVAASVISSYRELIMATQKRRNYVSKHIKSHLLKGYKKSGEIKSISTPPTNADRIAAAVAVLSPCMAVISKSEPYPSKDFFLNQQITKALAILEGRDQG